MEDQTVWTCDANGAVDISMVQPGDGGNKLKSISSFQPQFTYPIFGEDETIFGYKGLIIKLRFAAHDLKSNVHISYDERFQTVGDIEAVDLNKTLRPFLPEESFLPLPEFQKSVLNDESAKDFTPPGKLVHSYTRNQRNYEIWAGSLADPDVRALVDRIQIFVSLFIEAGTHIETNDFDWTLERWTVYFVYEKLAEPPVPSASPYSFVGYATTYRWHFFLKSPEGQQQQRVVSDGPFPYPEPLVISKLPARLRIAQFLILTTHQLGGHGTQLYRTIQRACLDDSTIHELTVEDPNEAFDVLRDKNDYHLLHPEFANGQVAINPNPYSDETSHRRPRLVPTAKLIPTTTLRDLRDRFKIAPTQFAHIAEMYLLGQIPEAHRGSENTNIARLLVQKSRASNENDRRYYWWRMLVKQRLYKRHRDTLMQLDLDERVEKLDETLRNVEEGYEILLKAVTKRAAAAAKRAEGQDEIVEGEANEQGEKGESGSAKSRAKRKYVVLEEDEEEEGDGDGGGEAGSTQRANGDAAGENGSSTKKVKA